MLIKAGFSDYWFPVTERGLPGIIPPSVRGEFVENQQLVLRKSIGLEKGEKHCHFTAEDPNPFESERVPGSGGYGQVDKVRSLVSFRKYARKQVVRSDAFRNRQKEDVKKFISEIEIMKRMEKHRHVVEFVGSYSDVRFLALIMSPVADMDLATYLTLTDNSNHNELRTFFGCLACALEFLHLQKFRHKDIKPGNILVHRGNVPFTDFGLSLDFADPSGSTTSGMAMMSKKYCSPETAEFEPQNTKSDIWSLGFVFMEMIVVLNSKSVQYMYNFISRYGSGQSYIRTNRAGFLQLVAKSEK